MTNATIPKPLVLTELHDGLPAVFAVVRARMGDTTEWRLDLTTIDIPADDLLSVQARRAWLLRQLQGLRVISTTAGSTSLKTAMGLVHGAIHMLASLYRPDVTVPSEVDALIAQLGTLANALAAIAREHGPDTVLGTG